MIAYPFICIEGVDGVGKTSVARRVAENLRGKYFKTPPPPFDSIRGQIDSLTGPVTRFHFYLSAVRYASELIKTECCGRPIVCDRYVYSTLAYHFVLAPALKTQSIPIDGICIPDIAFLLVASSGCREYRLTTRRQAIPIHDAKYERNRQFLDEVQREFQSFPLSIIETTNRSIDSVSEEISDATRLLMEKSSHAVL